MSWGVHVVSVAHFVYGQSLMVFVPVYSSQLWTVLHRWLETWGGHYRECRVTLWSVNRGRSLPGVKRKALEIRDGDTHRLKQLSYMEPCSLAAMDLGNPHGGTVSNRPSQSGLLEYAPVSQCVQGTGILILV